MHLAQSPHCSTCAINMHDNNLREESLLRHETARSTLPTPRTNRFVNEQRESHSRTRISTCIFSPALPQQVDWSPHLAPRCERTRHRSDGRDGGTSATSPTTRGPSARTA